MAVVNLSNLLLVVFIAVETAFCLRCYECDSSTNEKCAYHPQERTICQVSTFESELISLHVLNTAPKDYGILTERNACLKFVGINQNTDKEIVIRRCATYIEIFERTIEVKPLGYTKKFLDICFSDLCNSSSILSLELILIVPLIVNGIFFS